MICRQGLLLLEYYVLNRRWALYVGSALSSQENPPEIALAIQAEGTALRNGIDIKAQLNDVTRYQEETA